MILTLAIVCEETYKLENCTMESSDTMNVFDQGTSKRIGWILNNK